MNTESDRIYNNIKKNIEEHNDITRFDDRVMREGYTKELLSFKTFDEKNNLTLKTDASEVGGDTYCELDYNILEQALIMKGSFEMKRKNLIDVPIMFARITPKVIFYFKYILIKENPFKTRGELFNGQSKSKNKRFYLQTYIKFKTKYFRCLTISSNIKTI